MPNPDGTRTKDEHRRELIRRMMDKVHAGMDYEEALVKAGEEYREAIQQEGAEKIAGVMKFLGVKTH